MLPSIGNERDEDYLEASVSQEFLVDSAVVRSGVRKNESRDSHGNYNAPYYQSPQVKKQRENKLTFFEPMNGKNSSGGVRRSEMINRSQNFDEERDQFMKLEPITEDRLVQIEILHEDEEITHIIFENL